MKNTISRFLIGAILLALVSGIVVVIIGFTRGWNTYAQFSDGFFYAGAIMISIGALSVIGGNQRSASEPYTHSSSVEHLNMGERSRLWAKDMLRDYNVMALLGLSGLLEFVLSGLTILIGRSL
jgi:hypothetical protein